MKYFLFIFLLYPLISYSQEIKIKKIKELKMQDSGEYLISGYLPNGNEILITKAKYQGLYLYNLKKKSVKTISVSDGAGYNPAISNDGKFMVYRTNTFINHKKTTALLTYNLSNGDTLTLEKEKRIISQPVYTDISLNYISNGIIKSGLLPGLKSLNKTQDTVLLTDEFSPILIINGTTRSLKPNGEGRYIWANLSPDKSKIVYHLVGQGTFVSDLNGKIISSLGKFNAPKWLNNNILIGMDDKDNGYNTTSSELVAFSITTNRKIPITSTPDINEMYPYTSPDGKNIAFSTSDGKLFLMKIKIDF
jgi:Tol biopolymer transport system component